MPFPTTSVLDNFNTGASQGLSARAGWSSSHAAISFTDFITDGTPTKAVGQSGGSDNVWGTAFTNTEAYFTIADWPSSSGSFQVYARWTVIATASGYRVSHFSGTWQLQRWDAGAPAATVASGSMTTLVPGDSLGIECIGTTISAYYKLAAGAWTLLGSGTDATYASGNIAVTTDQPGNNIDNFGGGEVVSVGAPARDTHTAIPFTGGAGGGGKI